MQYISVCDGIGAAHVAWQPLGWKCLWTSEIEPFPAAVVEKRFGFENRGDMTKFKEWPNVEGSANDLLLVGGTPCQSFSVAGLLKGLHDPRGGLMLTFLEIAQGYRPRWVVWENVPGVLSSNGGRDFGSFLGALGQLGYGWAYRVLDAQWFGVAQRRRRVFVVGCLGDERRAAAVLFESESVRRNPAPSRAPGQKTTGPIAGCSNGGGANGPGRTADEADSLIPQPYAVANCLTQRMSKGINTTCDEGQTPILVQPFTKAKRAQSNEDDESWVAGDVAPTFNCFDQGDTRATTVVAFGLTTNQTPKFAEELQPTMQVPSSSGGGQPPAVAYDITGTLAKTGARETDVHTALRSRAPGQSEASTTTVVAFTQNCRDEVRAINGDGQLAGALSAHGGAHQTNYLAGANRTREGIKVPEVIGGDVTPALTNPGAGGRSDAINVCVPAVDAVQVQWASGGGKTENPTAQALRSNAEYNYQVARIGMAVRRLTPRECERLQGFSWRDERGQWVNEDYTAIEFRGKPAADGPRYKSLGNSMAVPVMRWIGERINRLA